MIWLTVRELVQLERITFRAVPLYSGLLFFRSESDTFLMNYTSILQPFVSKMNNCWTPVENMGKGIRNGSVTHDNAAEQTESMNEAMNSDGI